MGGGSVRVRDDAERQRYELRLDDTLAGHLAYRGTSGVMTLVHTEVDPELRERGLGTRLVAAVLDDLRVRGLFVVPVCPFVAAYIRAHPEYADLVAEA